MTLAHLSDTHLGKQAYARTDDHGINQREIDVMRSFRASMEAILERDPDLIVHSGDLFDRPRPSNTSIVGTYGYLRQIQDRRGHKPLVIVAGNHDTPRMTEAGNILRLFTTIEGVQVVTSRIEVLDFPALDLEVMAVPHRSMRDRENIELAPTGRRKFGVLTLHGVEHSLQAREEAQFKVEEARPDRWSYVAFGDWHTFKPYSANVCYAGSTDFTSTNIWEESKDVKGWVWFDSEVGRLEHVPVQTRRVVDLRWIDAARAEPKEVERQMRNLFEAAIGEDEPIMRQVVTNALPLLRSRVDPRMTREFQSRCLHYQVNYWPPLPDGSDGPARPGRASRSLDVAWDEHVMEAKIPAEINREALRLLGRELIAEVDDAPAEASA